MKRAPTRRKKNMGMEAPAPSEPGMVRYGEGEDVYLSEETTIYLIDVSGSMADPIALNDDGGSSNDDTILTQFMTKRAAVVYALRAMLTARQGYANGDKLGVVVFGGTVREYAKTLIVPSVISPEHFKTITSIQAHDSTPMYQGFMKAAHELKSAEGLVRIVLISDGEPNAGYTKREVLELVDEMHKDSGFVVDCLGIGVPGKTSEYDEKFLKQVANLGGGEFYPVESVDDLVKRLVEMVRERQLLIGSGIKLLAAVN